MNESCSYSFWDLYYAAFEKEISLHEKEEFLKKSQEEKNNLVRIWAEKAGWKTEERIGSDDILYVAFHP